MIGGGIRGIPDAVKNLLILNVLAFVAMLLLQSQGIDLNHLGRACTTRIVRNSTRTS